MKLQPLYDLQQEINRLFIAGSKFAKGDLRIQKQIPVFKKLGEKAPVFAKLATDIETLIQTDSKQSAEKLMALSTLLYSILYTQGNIVEENVDIHEQEPFIPLEDVNTGYSYLQLLPVIQALSVSNSGRLEVLKDAKERGIFNDSRTYRYLDMALADKYSELADYVEAVIIPAIGTPMLPFLQRNFRYVDKAENVRRLRLLEQLKYAGTPQMIKQILSGSLPLLQAEAVIILAKDPSNEELIMKLAGDKNKLVREAAFKALAKLGSKNAMERLKDIYIESKDKIQQLPAIVAALAATKLPYFFGDIFKQVKEAFEEFITLDKNAGDKILVAKLEKFGSLIKVFQNKQEQQVDHFYVQILSSQPFFEKINAKKNLLSNQIADTMHSVSDALAGRSDEQIAGFYDRYMAQFMESEWNGILWSRYFYAAEQLKWPKEKIFERFYPAYQKGYLQMNNLFYAFTGNEYYNHYTDYKDVVVYTDRIDKRWIDAMYDMFAKNKKWDSCHHQALIMLDAYEPDSKKINKLLESALKYTQPAVQINIFRYLMKRNVPDKYDTIYSAIEKSPGNANHAYWLNQLSETGFWIQFPEKYIRKFRTLGEKNKQEIYLTIADEIEKSKS